MQVKISLARYNTTQSLATIEDEFLGEIELAKGSVSDPKKTCLQAAVRLRELANRFQKLAVEDEPYKVKTQEKINTKP